MVGKTQIKNEILRYLGYKGQKLDNIINKMIDEIIEEIRSLIRSRYIYKVFNISSYENEIYLKDTNLPLEGEDIKNHLKNSNTCILMSATLGHEVDTKIRYYEKVDMTKALILDAAATAFIEDICDKICEEIKFNKIDKDKQLTSRYSPGYGDLPISIQNEFLNTLDAQRSIGLTASSNSILIPRKSITAIIGIIDEDEIQDDKGCMDCDKYRTCNFSKVGVGCGY